MSSPLWSLLMLLLVLALIPLVLWGLKRLQTFRPGGSAHQLEVTGQLALGARERVVLVRVFDRTLVLGVTAQQITLLAENENGIEAGSPQPGEQPAAAGFAGLLRTMRIASPGNRP